MADEAAGPVENALRAELVILAHGYNNLKAEIAREQKRNSALDKFRAPPDLCDASPLLEWIFNALRRLYASCNVVRVATEGLRATCLDIHPAIEEITNVAHALEVLRAGMEAASKVSRHHHEVFTAHCDNLESTLRDPPADGVSGKTRLYDLSQEAFKQACKDVKERKGSKPLLEVEAGGGAGGPSRGREEPVGRGNRGHQGARFGGRFGGQQVPPNYQLYPAQQGYGGYGGAPQGGRGQQGYSTRGGFTGGRGGFRGG